MPDTEIGRCAGLWSAVTLGFRFNSTLGAFVFVLLTSAESSLTVPNALVVLLTSAKAVLFGSG